MTYKPGDIFLVRDYSGQGDVIANLIMAGERARYGNSDYCRWTHSGLIVSEAGDIVEALEHGIRRTNISKYSKSELLIISPVASLEARAYAVRFALAHCGVGYDFVDFGMLAGSLLTGLNLSLHSDKRFICSGLCARATEAYTTSGYQYPSEAMLPADLGAYWGAMSGQPLPPLSFMGKLLDRLHSLVYGISPFTTGLRPTKEQVK